MDKLKKNRVVADKKKYLLLIDALGSGGAERQMSYLASELNDAGHTVKLVTFYDTADFYTDALIRKGVNVETHLEGRSQLKRPFVIQRLVKSFRPDMTIAYKDGVSMAACITKLFCKFRLAVSERNTTQVLSKKERLKFNLYRFADHIIPNSFSQSEFIKIHYPGLTPKITVITNMIDISYFRPDDNKVYSNCQEPLIGTIARVMDQKNVLRYLEAIKLLKDSGVKAKFVWFGKMPDSEYSHRVLKLIDSLSIKDMIEFPGVTADAHSVYQHLDFFCLPSKFEGFPNVLCEAMASGCVVCASAVCDNQLILKNAPDYLFNPDDVENIAAVIRHMISVDPIQRYKIGSENRERIIRLCSPESFIAKYQSLK